MSIARTAQKKLAKSLTKQLAKNLKSAEQLSGQEILRALTVGKVFIKPGSLPYAFEFILPYQYAEVLAALRYVKRYYANSKLVVTDFGVCAAVGYHLEKKGPFVLHLAFTKFVGQCCQTSWPIPAPTKSETLWANERWTGKQLEQRLILINELIDLLVNAIKLAAQGIYINAFD